MERNEMTTRELVLAANVMADQDNVDWQRVIAATLSGNKAARRYLLASVEMWFGHPTAWSAVDEDGVCAGWGYDVSAEVIQ